MDGISFLGLNRSSLIDGVADDVHDPSEGFRADGDADGCACVDDFLASDETFGGVHGDGPHPGVSEVLCDFEDESVLDALDLQRVEDGRDLPLELHVDHGADDLYEVGATWEIWPFLRAAAFAPEK